MKIIDFFMQDFLIQVSEFSKGSFTFTSTKQTVESVELYNLTKESVMTAAKRIIGRL